MHDDGTISAGHASARKAIELSIDSELAAAAEAAGIDMSELLEQAIRAETKAARSSRWRAENLAAIETSNAEIERNGLWCDPYRVW